jgi:pre-rRNA-processing protein TSR3
MEKAKKTIKLYVYHERQCDPKKCTALKLNRHGKAKVVYNLRYIPKKTLILNPLVSQVFSPLDRELAVKHGIVAIDCSWKKIEEGIPNLLRGRGRILPALVAVNPINYGKIGMLSTAEALAAALYIIGFENQAKDILSIFKWGLHFLELNEDFLEAYRNAKTPEEVVEKQNKLLKEKYKLDI